MVCSNVVKKTLGVSPFESIYDLGKQFGDFGFLSLLGPTNGSVGKGSDCNGEWQAQIA